MYESQLAMQYLRKWSVNFFGIKKKKAKRSQLQKGMVVHEIETENCFDALMI